MINKNNNNIYKKNDENINNIYKNKLIFEMTEKVPKCQ